MVVVVWWWWWWGGSGKICNVEICETSRNASVALMMTFCVQATSNQPRRCAWRARLAMVVVASKFYSKTNGARSAMITGTTWTEPLPADS